MSDYSGRDTGALPAEHTTGNPFHGLMGKVHQATHAITDKVHEITSDPGVRQHVHDGGRIAGNIGTGVFNGVKQDGQGMASDVKSGNYAGAALRAAPLLFGGPVGLVVKEVAPKVVAEGIKQLPAGTRNQIESTGAGRIIVGTVAHGGIPTSPGGLFRVASDVARRSAVDAVISNATDNRVHTAQSQYPAASLRVNLTAIATRETFTALTRPHQNQIVAARSREAEPVQAMPRETQAAVSFPHQSQPPVIHHDASVAPANVVNRTNQVFPSWMKPANTDASKH
jgi:hypothetical protein